MCHPLMRFLLVLVCVEALRLSPVRTPRSAASSGFTRATARPPLAKSRAGAVTLHLASPMTPIDGALVTTWFPRGIEPATSEELIRRLAKGSYRLAGDLLDASPDTIRSSMRHLGVQEFHQDAICIWHTKQLQETKQLQQARDRPLPDPTCTLDSRPGRQTPLS